MTKIYIIKAAGGRYDDVWEHNLFATADESQAKVEVQRLEDDHVFLTGIMEVLTPMVQEAYAQVRAFVREPTPQEPKGPAKGTKEDAAQHRRARDEWRAACQPIQDRNQRAINKITSDGALAALAKALELGCTDERIEALGFYRHGDDVGITMPRFDTDVSYDYEELELR